MEFFLHLFGKLIYAHNRLSDSELPYCPRSWGNELEEVCTLTAEDDQKIFLLPPMSVWQKDL